MKPETLIQWKQVLNIKNGKIKLFHQVKYEKYEIMYM